MVFIVEAGECSSFCAMYSLCNCREKEKIEKVKHRELKQTKDYCVKRGQTHAIVNVNNLGLKTGNKNVLLYQGRVPGYNLIFIPMQYPRAAKSLNITMV